jgi:hypothetical protein
MRKLKAEQAVAIAPHALVVPSVQALRDLLEK